MYDILHNFLNSLVENEISYLLVILIFTLFYSFSKIRKSLDQLCYFQSQNAEMLKKQTELLSHIADTYDQISENCCSIGEIESDISQIRHTMDVIHKYRLPDKEEQELLDRIKLDNEFSKKTGL
ncbi:MULTISPECIES: hypothetical protein [Cysteiniphilum]|uniref:Uncharacterized protein n=1 Tax=Cysteiniphilum litorale TaxID=2056700 RepID=A0A8J3E9P1_9GAMM|nr:MULTISPECIES: hypothetical protein [Cysteiniphilum]GGG03031.1 hypothetical protein GCM10010995_20610 [Cysteiniphilum litorale]